MQPRPLKQLCGAIAATTVLLALIACDGKTGPAGANGANGTNGTNGINGTNGTNAVAMTDVSKLTPEQWSALKATVKITGVTMGAAPVVSFQMTDAAGLPITGLSGFTAKSSTAVVPSYPNLAFVMAKLVPQDATTKAPSKWVSYIVTSAPTTIAAAAPARPTTDNTGTLVDNGDGTYKYTFYRDITKVQAALDAATYTAPSAKADLGDVTYAPSLIHRLTIQFSGAARGTGSNTANAVTVTPSVNLQNPVNAIYDFVPATGAPLAAGADNRDVVSISNCNECHDKLAFHGGGRVEVRYCAVCHTDQRKFGYAEATTTATGYDAVAGQRKINGGAVGDLTALAHRIHRGGDLTKDGYNYANVKFEKLGYSMLGGGEAMCSKCHDGVAQAQNWNLKPSRLACGTCHDQVDFATGVNHMPGTNVPQADDAACTICHDSAAIKTYHMTLNVTPHNPTVAAGLVNFTYEIKSAAVTGTTATVVFKIKADGTAVTFNPAAAGLTASLAGFTGGPSFLMAYTQDQDGIVAPADYNNLGRANGQPLTVSIANLLDTNKALTSGTMSATADANGYYTATILNAFPATATLRSVALQGYFTQITAPGTATAGIARHAISVVKPVTGDTVRRAVIDSAKCAKCHEWFEGHGGNRVYEVQVCVTCHVPGLTTSGRGTSDAQITAYYTAGSGKVFSLKDQVSLKAWTGIDFATNPVSATSTNVALAFPQTTNNFKDMIHGIHAGKDRTSPIEIVRNRGGNITIIDGARIGFPGILSDCQSCHTSTGYNVPTTGKLFASRELADNGAILTTTDANTALNTVSPTDKMITPFTAACATCHDSAPAKAHMVTNGGQILVNRSALNVAGEACAICHGAGSQFDPVAVHK